MDLTTLMAALLSDKSVNSVSKKAGVDSSAVASVMAAALPALLNGANQQASQKETTESFYEAVTEHAAKDPKKVDVAEGEKIVEHLLGEDETAKTEKAVAKATGLSKGQVALILAAAAPLIMNLLGKQTTASNSNSAASTASLLGNLLGGGSGSTASNALMTAALASVLSNAMGGGSSKPAANASILGSVLNSALGANTKPQAAASNDLLTGLIGSALTGGAVQQQQSASNATGSLLSGLMGLLK